MIDLLQYEDQIRNIIDTHECTIDLEILEHFESKYNDGKSGYSNLKNCQAELLEYTLIKQGKLLPTETYKNDGHWPFAQERWIDFKRKPVWSRNIVITKFDTKQTWYDEGLLHYFIAFQQSNDGLLELNQKHTFKFIKLMPFLEAKEKAFEKDDYHLLKVA